MKKSILKFSKRSLIVLAFLLTLDAMASKSVDEWFDSYGKLPWEEERLHLDNFAIYLKRNPEMVGYLAYYVGDDSSEAEMEARIGRAKEYLICEFKIDKKRIIVVKAEKREKTKVVLQPVSKEKRPPDF
jgi:hypothetical protein